MTTLFLMLTKDIAVKASTFRRDGFKKFAEASMSRRYIKNALFLFLFACLTIAVYTVFLNVKSGARRGGIEGFVQNMVVEAPKGYKEDSHKPFDENLDDSKNNLEDQGRNFQEDLLQAQDPDRNAHWPAEVRDEQVEADEYEKNQGGNLNHDEDDIPINNAIDSKHDEDVNDFIEAHNDQDEEVRIPQIDPEEVRVRDMEGNIVGYKLFPHGIHPDHNKPPEERERDLRRRLGLPPKELKEPKELVPEVRKETQEPDVLPRQKIIDAGGMEDKPEETEKDVDDLGAFHLKDRVPNRVDGFLRQDDFNDGQDGGFAIDDIENNHENDRGRLDIQNQLDDDGEADNILDDRFADGRNPQLAHLDDRLQPARHGQILPPRDSFNAHEKAYPDRFPQRNDFRDAANGHVNPKRYGNGNIGAIIRPIGNNGMNPFHLGQQGEDNIMPHQMPDRGRMAPFANNQGMPYNQLQNAPMNNNRVAPFPLNQGAVPNDRGMDPIVQQNGGMTQDPFQNAPMNNRGMDAFGRNRERINEPIPGDSRGRNPFAPRNEGRDLPDRARLSNGLRDRFAQQDVDNRKDVTLRVPMNDRIKNWPEVAQGNADSLTDDTYDEDKDILKDNPFSAPIEAKPPAVLNQMPIEDNDDQETPLDIKDISKPLPVSFDCISFLFPPKKGTLCLHEPEHDKALSGVIKTRGIWEPSMLAGFFAVLKSHPELNVVDIGAGIGVYTLTAALMDRKVLAVEPLFWNYRMLHKSALENEVSHKITLVAQAIGSESYMGHLNYSDETGGYSQAHVDKISDSQANPDSPDVVQVTTLNNLVQALSFDSAVLKIDVGGFMESDVLASSSKFFKALRVPFVLTHWNFHTGVMKKIQVATMLNQKGYHPRTEWNGADVDPNVLKGDLNYLIWAL